MPLVGIGKKSFQQSRQSLERPSNDQASSTTPRPSNAGPSSRASSRAAPRTSFSKNSTNGQTLPLPQRFNLMRSRWSSDPTLSSRYRADGERSQSPEVEGAPAPVIGVTAPPPPEPPENKKTKIKFRPFAQKVKDQNNRLAPSDAGQLRAPKSFDGARIQGFGSASNLSTMTDDEDTDHESAAKKERRSESGYHVGFGRRQAKGNSVSPNGRGATSSLLSTLKRKNKTPKSLFPLPVKFDAPSDVGSNKSNAEPTSEALGDSSHLSDGPKSSRTLGAKSPLSYSEQSVEAGAMPSPGDRSIMSPPMLRHGSATSVPSVKSSPPAPSYRQHSLRRRSNTLNSVDVRLHGSQTPPPQLTPESGRNSTASTTVGRNSIAGLRSLTSRLRQTSDATMPRKGSPGSTVVGQSHMSSQNNSFAISRDSLVAPEREEGETAVKYYSRVEQDIPKRSLALVFSKKSDTFSHDVLRSLLRTFKFYEDPMDISIRRFLWEITLPGEGQQIDRVITAFAERYYECNPHIFDSVDQATVVAFSMIMLHSDLFNRNNKHKMQRWQYQKNTGGQGIADEILGYFYDNIQYTEFIAQTDDDEDADIASKSAIRKTKRAKSKPVVAETVKTGKLDPYDIILDEKTKMDVLRPSLKDVLQLEDSYNFRGTSDRFNHVYLQQAFAWYGVLQVVSSQSKAYSSPSTAIDNDLEDARAGVIEFKVAKAGILWRKDSKKRKTRSPWQEWGAVLTSSSLFLFKNDGWVKSLMHQQEAHQRKGHRSTPVIFAPQLTNFEPDTKVPTFHAIALQDVSYKRHKHAFILARQGSSMDGVHATGFFEEVFLAENESEMNDWIAKLNYASTFQSQGITIRAPRLPEKRDQSNGQLRQVHSNVSSKTGQSTKSSPSSKLPPQDSLLSSQVMNARKQAVSQKLDELDSLIASEMKSLDGCIRTARHLQILAPFPQKTRNDLLTYGARISYKLKWLRFEVWRLKTQKEILTEDLDEEASKPDLELSLMAPLSPSIPSKSSTLGRLSSKAGATLAVHKSSKSKTTPRFLGSPSVTGSKESDLAGGIDEAFATPSETLSRMASANDSPFALPPLNLNLDNDDPSDSLSQQRQQPSSPVRLVAQSSTSSLPSKPDGTESEGADVSYKGANSVAEEADVSAQEERLSTAVESDREQTVASIRPESRSNVVRRSLHRTLRDSRDSQSSRNPRSKRTRDSMSTSKDDASSILEGESLSRGTGSFRIHGHKASVVNVKLGTEWQQLSVEERYKVRQVGGPEYNKPSATDDESEANKTTRSSVDRTSFTTARRGSTLSEKSSGYESGVSSVPAA